MNVKFVAGKNSTAEPPMVTNREICDRKKSTYKGTLEVPTPSVPGATVMPGRKALQLLHRRGS